MRWRVISLFFLILATVFFIWSNPRFARVPRACEEPIAYTIGTLDRKFGLTQKEFLNALSQAETIWEGPLGMELFAYEPESGKLLVNLIYDYRQETTDTLSDLGVVLEENETTYKVFQAEYAELKTTYESAKDVYNARAEAFNEINRAYEEAVEIWNDGPRTSRAQFNKLEKSRAALEAEAAALEILEARLNEAVGEINALVERLNRLAARLNLGVEAYNTIGGSRGESFTGGAYYSAEGDRGIDIYEFSSRDKLVRVLAHELGHALGLDHNNNPEAIMYYLNEDDAGVLSETDLSALKALCGAE